MPDQNAPVPAAPVSAPTPTPTPMPTNQIGATSNPQTAPPISTSGNSGYKPSASDPTVVKSPPITQEGGYYQSRATDLGLMEQSPKSQNLPPMSASLGSTSQAAPRYGTGGIMKVTGFQKPDSSSFQSGTSLTNSIPNIMADNNVQSAIGSVTQPVSTGLMRGVPKLKQPYLPEYKTVDLYGESSVPDLTN